ncbi:MAG: DUF2272 domain-containing protein, partial [Stenotrophomonas sp.]
CTPGREEECSFNRQDWAALLKLVATAPAMAPMPPPDPAGTSAAPLVPQGTPTPPPASPQPGARPLPPAPTPPAPATTPPVQPPQTS